MAASKKKASSKQVATRGKQEITNVDDELSKEVASIKDRIGAPDTKAISIKDKIFTFPDGTINHGPLELVIVDFVNWNKYYDRPFDEKNPTPPACFAVASRLADLVPDPDAPDVQSDACANCWANEFGSGTGDSKACKNQRMLVVMRAEDDPAEGELFTLSVPAASLKRFDAYVNAVANAFNAPPVRVVTQVAFVADTTYPALAFGRPVANANYREHYSRRAEARDMLTVKPDTSMYESPTPARGRAASKKKSSARR